MDHVQALDPAHEPAARAASTPTTAGSSSYETTIRSAASSATYRSVATTITTGSPTWFTSPLASG